MSHRRHCFLVATLLLAGCAYHPNGDKPATELPATLATTGETAAIWPNTDWWQGFGSAELDALIATAQDRNLDLAAAAARVRQAAALARVAEAPLLPAVGIAADASRQSTNGSSGAVSGSYAEATLTASYELDLWGRVSANAAAARSLIEASRYARETVALTTVAAVAGTYFQVLGARERLAIARDDLVNAREVLRIVAARARNGAALTREVVQQQALVATREAAIPPLAQAETEALAALALLLDRPPQGFTVGAGSLDGIASPAVAPGLPAALLTRRPDIAEAEARLAAADADIAAARAAMLPRIDLSGLAGVQEAVVSGGTGGGGLLYMLGAGLTRPIFDNGALAGRRDYTIAQREELVARYRSTVLAALADVQKALHATDHAARQQQAQEQAVADSRRAFALAESEYRAGAADLLTVLDTARTLYAAQDALAQTRLVRLQALVALFKALGGGWQQGGAA
ncbi:MAG TPA: efflux transporter outer membrane subunit [Stellaceae bacterium]|nr:efflux transporter outer membrane subunit [Stellaceae bacterium]